MANDPISLEEQLSTPAGETKPTEDIFLRDWVRERNFWLRYHAVWDQGYLNYKSILTNVATLGDEYIRAYGLNAFAPLTFQTVEALKAQVNGSRTEFLVKSETGARGFLDSKRAKYFQIMDNSEWVRAKAEQELRNARHNALLFGNGYLLDFFADEREIVHLPELEEEKDTAPEGGNDGQSRSLNINDTKALKFKEKEITRYRGVRIESLNPYYVFPDSRAKGDRWRYCYYYYVGSVEDVRDLVVNAGWLSMEEAQKKIVGTQVQRFDGVRDTIDSLFSMSTSQFTRGDHPSGSTAPTGASNGERRGDEAALIIRYEKDVIEVRLADATELVFKGYSIYPHKEIPITVLKNNPTPDEPCGMGEPEVIRWQQIGQNKVHNLLLDAVLMSVVQRYAVNTTLLEDPTDISFYNPFKPIRLKNLPGISVAQAVMPLPQPEVKQSPFQLLALMKEMAQQASGASDFIVSSNDSIADTAAESNNLLAATTMRIKDKVRYINETSLPRIMHHWHANFYYFYDEEMDYQKIGEDTFIRWLPYDRHRDNTDETLIKAAIDLLNSTGKTLEEVYRNAGYEEVIFLSDVVEGSFSVEVRVTDVEADKRATFEDLLRVVKLGNETNAAAKERGDSRSVDTFAIFVEAIKHVSAIPNVQDYIKGSDKITGKIEDPNMPAQGMAPPGQKPAGADALTGIRQGQVSNEAGSPQLSPDTNSLSTVPPVQGTNGGMDV